MTIFGKIKKMDAQHTIEYVVLLILVMAGIIIAGPYVVRSWNAYLKGWDDSVVDSIEDPLLEPPSPSMPDCFAGDWERLGCGTGTSVCGSNQQCDPQAMTKRLSSSPPNCLCSQFPASELFDCEVDDDNHCCGPWMPDPPSLADCGLPACPFGEYLAYRYCDTGYREEKCLPHEICVFTCNPPPDPGLPPEYGVICPGDDMDLPYDMNYTIVPHNGCTDPRKCEWQCAPFYCLIDTGAYAYCGACDLCGDGICDPATEDCLNCKPDCGACDLCWIRTGITQSYNQVACTPGAILDGQACTNLGDITYRQADLQLGGTCSSYIYECKISEQCTPPECLPWSRWGNDFVTFNGAMFYLGGNLACTKNAGNPGYFNFLATCDIGGYRYFSGRFMEHNATYGGWFSHHQICRYPL